MRAFIFRLLFGSDQIVQRMCKLLELRRLAISRHARNERLAAELESGEARLLELRGEYAVTRTSLEEAYRLEF